MAAITGIYHDTVDAGTLALCFGDKEVLRWRMVFRVKVKIVNAVGRGRYRIIVKESLGFKLFRMLYRATARPQGGLWWTNITGSRTQIILMRSK